MITVGPALDELRRWLSAVDRLALAVTSPGELPAVLDLVADTARDLLGYDFCAVLLPDPTGTHLLITGWSGLSEDYVASVNADRPVQLALNGSGQAPSGRAFSSGRTVAISDIAAEPEFVPWGGVARDQGYRAMVSVPLIADGAVLGTLNGYRAHVHDFDGDEVERLTLLANHAALALTSARLVDRLRDQAELLTKSERIHGQLLDVALGGGGLPGIVHALAELIGQPVVIEDADGQVSAVAGGAAELPPPELRAAASGDAVADGAEVAGRHVWTVWVAGDVAARLWVGPGHLSALDRRAVEHGSLVLSLELARIRTAVEVELRLRGELLTDVLGGAAADSPAVRDRAARLGHDLSGPAVVVVGRVEPADPARRILLEQRVLAAAADLAARFHPRPLVGTYRGVLAVLWPAALTDPVPDPARGTGSGPGPGTGAGAGGRLDARIGAGTGGRVGEAVRRALRSVPGVAAATVCVSPPAADYPLAFRMARGGLEIGLAGGRIDTAITLDDLGVAGLLLQVDDPGPLVAFADRTLAPVRRHDAQRGTQLLDTLRCYLAARQNRAATAQALHLHPNTVTQRLQRVESLTGLELADPEAMVQVRAALTVLDVAGFRFEDGEP
ncbi:helix-turn-helix domain-containing protein [Nakamurella multipartita]|uniref:Transcriptional regulator, CdaR n=1 Tax=Nakamurella multipartita (strain ATCC 700099 / DSM 44233 / CIP 104796 / JCM 9543 / NBRC 105858 / Y-104) TaxID=479431 RepID=C8X9X0_NAKMY|nr:GAF domain-containing protein [Nakamurella multipartita]ACV81170.1 transcriptional regulator, CdaR [Nakamurella multipartita DSM 44233]